MVALTVQFPGDGVGEVDPQDGPRPPPSPLAPHHGGQTAQVVDHPHSPCSTFFVLAPQDMTHREEQEELDWALDQLPHHRTKRSPQSCCKSYADLASKQPKHSFYTKRFFYAAKVKVRSLQVSLPDRGKEVGDASWIPIGPHSHPCSSFSQVSYNLCSEGKSQTA